jgi:magnesium chelatase family protein
LFLDEFPLFRSDVLEALRQPLESGDVTIARQEELVTLPARGMLVLASNPCPCGEYHAKASANRCTCSEKVRRDYRNKITGPLSDRIDIVRHVEPLLPHESADRFARLERSEQVRTRVAAARLRQGERYAERSWRLNAHAPGPLLREHWPLAPAGQQLVDTELFSGRLSSRGAVRVHRLAWTVADLAAVRTGADVWPGGDEVQLALSLRTGNPLPAGFAGVRAS